MNADELLLVAQLTDSEIEEIDDALAAGVTERFRKAAMVIGIAMARTPASKVPDLFYFQRLLGFVDRGLIELAGYRENMRFCEVRLPRKSD